jgi:hypothetical protein
MRRCEICGYHLDMHSELCERMQKEISRAEKAESLVKELEALVPSERDVVIKAKAQFPAGVSVGEVVTAIIEKVGMVEMIHKHLGYYLAELEKKS